MTLWRANWWKSRKPLFSNRGRCPWTSSMDCSHRFLFFFAIDNCDWFSISHRAERGVFSIRTHYESSRNQLAIFVLDAIDNHEWRIWTVFASHVVAVFSTGAKLEVVREALLEVRSESIVG